MIKRFHRLVLASLALTTQSAVANTIVVSPTGSITTIQAGIAAAGPGDTVKVLAGVYTGLVTLPSTKPGIQLVGKGKVVLDARADDGAGLGVGINIDAEDAVVRGITIRNAAIFASFAGDGIVVFKPRATITSCRIVGAQQDGIDIRAEDVVVSKCVVVASDHGIRISGGDRAKISKTTLQQSRVAAVKLDAGADVTLDRLTIIDAKLDGVRAFNPVDRVTVSKCTIFCGNVGLRMLGDEAILSGNKILLCGSGITTTDNLARITKNRIEHALDGTAGIALVGSTNALVEGNTCVDSRKAAVSSDTASSGATLRKNVALRAGSQFGEAYSIAGAGHTLEACRATDGFGDGFVIVGDAITLDACVATRCVRDGFDVEATADAASFVKCVATQCDAEGFDNAGTSTSLTQCVAKQNRLDVANAGGLNLIATTFATGGAATAPELD